jgi:hypothetical protein
MQQVMGRLFLGVTFFNGTIRGKETWPKGEIPNNKTQITNKFQ